MGRTTDLDKIKTGQPFTWGDIEQIHYIAEYTIVEFHPFIYVNNCGTNRIDYATTEYSLYIDGHSIGRSALSMDEALAECIGYKHDGNNSHAAQYFMKMIKP